MSILIPLIGKVILKVEQPDEATKNGLIIPDLVKKQKNEGTVFAVNAIKGFHADGTANLSEVSVGDKILFLPHSAQEIEFEQQKYLVVSHEAIVGKISPDGHV